MARDWFPFNTGKLIYVTALCWLPFPLASCLSCMTNCSCSLQNDVIVAVNCSGKGWTSFPVDLPETLKYLDLSLNRISNPWTASLFSLTNLISLNLAFNGVQTLPSYILKTQSEDNLRGNTNLNVIRKASIKKADTNIKDGLKHLEILSLQNNLISRIHNVAFRGFINLQTLDLSQNLIQRIDVNAFSGLRRLKMLNLYDNFIALYNNSHADEIFADLHSLRELHLHGNFGHQTNHHQTTPCHQPNLPDYPDGALSRIASLEKIFMDGLPAPAYPGKGFRNLTKLSFVYFGALAGSKCFMGEMLENFFSNFATRKPLELVFDYCTISRIHPAAFARVSSLQNLSLIYSRLNFENFTEASASLNQTHTKKLDLSGTHSGPDKFVQIRSEWFVHLMNTSLQILILDHNSIIDFEPRFFTILPRTITSLSLVDNAIITLTLLYSINWMTSLQIFDGRSQNNYTADLGFSSNQTGQIISNKTFNGEKRIEQLITLKVLYHLQESYCPTYRVPRTYFTGERVFKTSSKMSATKNWESGYIFPDLNRTHNTTVMLPESLTELRLGNVKLGYAVPRINIWRSVLLYLDLSNNYLWCLDGPLLGLKKLKVLDLSKNDCIALSPYFFSDMPELRALLLQYNTIGPSLEADKDGETFSKLLRLEYIDVSHNAIRTLHPKVFKQSANLQTILLNNNALQVFDIDVGSLNKLTLVDLSANALVTLPKRMMTSLDTLALSSPNLTLDLHDNDLLCDCSNTDLITWYIKTKINFRRKELYKCRYVNGSVIYTEDLINVQEITWRYCAGQQILVPVLTSFLTTLVILTALGFYSYFRVRLLFYIYISKARYFRNFYDQDQARVKDVFLVYDDQEIRWRQFAIKVVKPELECRGVSVYISEVDALAGRPLRTTIEESVLAARKTLVLLTPELFMCEERELEIGMAIISEELRCANVLVFLLVEAVPEGSIPLHIDRVLKERGHFEYRPNHAVFWDDLSKALRY